MWNEYLMIAVFVLCGLLAACFIANLVLTARGKESNPWLNRGLYIFGMLAVVCNFIRMVLDGSGVMAFANVVVLFCVVFAFVRAERERKYGPEPDEEEESAQGD